MWQPPAHTSAGRHAVHVRLLSFLPGLWPQPTHAQDRSLLSVSPPASTSHTSHGPASGKSPSVLNLVKLSTASA